MRLKLAQFSFLVILASCSNGPEEYLFQGGTMGTTWSVKVVTDESIDQAAIQQGIQQVLDNVNAKMSNWDSESEVSLFNASAAGCYPVSEDTIAVVDVSQTLSRLSEGVFDSTVGPLIELWGFGTNFTSDQMPEQSEIDLALEWVGYQNLRLNDSQICKDIDELFVNLSATAKGYGVDLVAEYLEVDNFDRYLVEVGGEVRVLGLNRDNQKWRIGIESPLDSAIFTVVGEALQDMVEMESGALATSGDYRNYFIHEGIRYSHVIDPNTGYPVPQQLASVTVIHESTLWADGWATTLLALGPEKGLALAEENGVAAYLVLRTDTGFEVLTSSIW